MHGGGKTISKTCVLSALRKDIIVSEDPIIIGSTNIGNINISTMPVDVQNIKNSRFPVKDVHAG